MTYDDVIDIYDFLVKFDMLKLLLITKIMNLSDCLII